MRSARTQANYSLALHWGCSTPGWLMRRTTTKIEIEGSRYRKNDSHRSAKPDGGQRKRQWRGFYHTCRLKVGTATVIHVTESGDVTRY